MLVSQEVTLPALPQGWPQGLYSFPESVEQRQKISLYYYYTQYDVVSHHKHTLYPIPSNIFSIKNPSYLFHPTQLFRCVPCVGGEVGGRDPYSQQVKFGVLLPNLL